MLNQIIKHAHSGFRWLLLFFLLATIVLAIVGFIKKRDYSKFDRLSAMLAMSFAHLQLLLGLLLYFISDKVVFSAQSMSNHLLRFFLIEHLFLMLVAITLITIGYTNIKKADKVKKHKKTLLFYGIALVIMLIGIPWPWQLLGAGWF